MPVGRSREPPRRERADSPAPRRLRASATCPGCARRARRSFLRAATWRRSLRTAPRSLARPPMSISRAARSSRGRRFRRTSMRRSRAMARSRRCSRARRARCSRSRTGAGTARERIRLALSTELEIRFSEAEDRQLVLGAFGVSVQATPSRAFSFSLAKNGVALIPQLHLRQRGGRAGLLRADRPRSRLGVAGRRSPARALRSQRSARTRSSR